MPRGCRGGQRGGGERVVGYHMWGPARILLFTKLLQPGDTIYNLQSNPIYNPQSIIGASLQIPHLCLSYRFFCFNYAPHFIRVQIFRLHFRGRNAQFSIRTKEWMFSEYLLNFFGSEIWVITLARATSFRQIYLISLKNESLFLYVFFRLIKNTQMTP